MQKYRNIMISKRQFFQIAHTLLSLWPLYMNVVESVLFFWVKRVAGEIYLASPLLWWCCTEGHGRPSAALPWPMRLQRPRSAADALALACPITLPPVCEHIPAGGLEGCGGLDAGRGKNPAPRLLRNAAGLATCSHIPSNTINQVTGISLISYWGEQPEKLRWRSWPRNFGHGPSLCGHQASMSRFLCCHHRHFHFYSYSFCLPRV